MLLDGLAAVDDHGASDDEGGGVRAQPKDGGGDLLGLAHPPDWFLRDYCLLSFRGAAEDAGPPRLGT